MGRSIDWKKAMYCRLSKILLIWSAGIFTLLVTINNITDYQTNYNFVAHVLKMDTILPENNMKWRAVQSPLIHHIVYTIIILVEAFIALLCLAGGLRLLRNVNDVKKFNGAKGISVAGLTMGILLWFFGFTVIGGEWFQMWQSDRWNGTQGAFRITLFFAAILVYLNMPDHEDH